MKVASKAALSFAVLIKDKSRSRGTTSILLRMRNLRVFTSARRSRMASASSSSPLRASISTPARSASCAPLQALVTMARSSRLRGEKIPGVSTKISCVTPLDGDAADQRARGLNLARDNRDFRADQCVEQSRLAGVGRADQRDKAAARSRLRAKCQPSSLSAATPTRSSMAAAADCSAARLEEPTPSAGGRSGSTTATRNLGLWCGPVRANSR